MDASTERSLTSAEIDRLVTLGGRFLRTLSTRPTLRAQMVALGYTEADHKDGWRLLLDLIGYNASFAVVATDRPVVPQEQAILFLDAWDEPNFRRSRVALHRLHPDQEAYVFRGLEAGQGPAAVGAVKVFIDRVCALRDGTDPSREATRKEDRAAAKTLSDRFIFTPEVETQLRGHIEMAQQLAALPATPDPDPTELEAATQRKARALKAWLDDWRITARTGLTRRDYKIQLGVVRKRASKPDEDETDDADETEDDIDDDLVEDIKADSKADSQDKKPTKKPA